MTSLRQVVEWVRRREPFGEATVVFERVGQSAGVHVMDVATRRTQKVLPDCSHPRLSMDRRFLAVTRSFLEGDDLVHEIAIHDRRDDGFLSVSRKSGGLGHVEWSRCGRYLCFSQWMRAKGCRDVWLADLWEGSERRVAETGGFPVFLPDGRIAAASTGEDARMLLLDPESGRSEEAAFMSKDLVNPCWSPDGTCVVAEDSSQGTSQGGPLCLLNLAEGRWKPLPARGFDPTWAPDGQSVVFAAGLREGHGREIAALRLDTGQVTQFTSNGPDRNGHLAEDWYPHWM